MGGKGINVAVVAGRLGLDVQCVGIMGENGAAELTWPIRTGEDTRTEESSRMTSKTNAFGTGREVLTESGTALPSAGITAVTRWQSM